MTRSNGMVSRPITSGHVPDGEIPQSTLAAQLLHRLEGDQRGSSHQRATFRQLLQEVLDVHKEPSGSAVSVNSDVTNYKLVFVIVKAGLDPLIAEDSLSHHDEGIEQALDSIKAISITLSQTPGLLATAIEDDTQNDVSNAPMLFWLLPKLVLLMCSSKVESVRVACENCLLDVLAMETKMQPKGYRSQASLRLLQGCVNDILGQLDMHDGSLMPSSVSFSFPSQETRSSVLLSSEGCVLQPKEATATVKSKGTARTILVCFLRVLAKASTRQLTEHRSSPRNKAFIDWLQHALARLWRLNEFNEVERQELKATLFQSSLLDVTLCLMWISRRDVTINDYGSLVLPLDVIYQILSQAPLPFEKSVQVLLCLNIIEVTRHIANAIKSGLRSACTPSLTYFSEAEPEKYKDISSDVKKCLDICIEISQSVDYESARKRVEAGIDNVEDAVLRQSFSNAFGMDSLQAHANGNPPTKRQRTSINGGSSSRSNTRPFSEIQKIIDSRKQTRLDGLRQLASSLYLQLPEDEQSLLFLLLGRLACTAMSGWDQDLSTMPNCPDCNDSNAQQKHSKVPDAPDITIVSDTLVDLIKLLRSSKSRKPRVAAMQALPRVLRHTADKEYLDLSSSYLGQHCLASLRSSLRELRIGASRALGVFLTKSLDQEMTLRNRLIALDYLRQISENGDLCFQETCILALGQMSRVVEDGDVLNLVLLKLVEYLGHPNALLNGLAYDELQMVSNHSPFTAKKIFAPYWRTIGVTAIQDLSRRPQITQYLSDLLDLTIPAFLVLIQVNVVPYLVLKKRQDMLQRIADAKKQSISDLCRDHDNMAAILANILLQTSSNVEQLVLNLLIAVSPDFSTVNSADLFMSEPQATASELLKHAGEYDEKRKPKARDALQFLANVTQGRPASSRETRQSDTMGPFFDIHVLGIMAILADTINDDRGPQSVLEKKRCLRAIREMINFAHTHVSNGIPQICGCLRSAIETPDLANEGFDAWLTMIKVISEDDVSPLIEPTMALLIAHWDEFLPSMQQQAYDVLSIIFKTKQQMIRRIVDTLPSLAQIPLMSKFEEDMAKLKAQRDVKHHFASFCKRLQSENAAVVRRALQELANFLEVEQTYLYELANSEQPDTLISRLTRSLLNTSVLFSSSDRSIAILCARCLGMVGCLDSTRVETIREKKEILVLSNFTQQDEFYDFILLFLEEVLVKAFLSATNSRSQGFLAYTIQQLLATGDFAQSARPRPREIGSNTNYIRWMNLPESVRTLLTPFLSSRYFVTPGAEHRPCSYPIYESGISHAQWLRALTYDLLKRDVGHEAPRTLFQILSRIIRFQDKAIATFLVPFATLNAVISGSDADRKAIITEFSSILGVPLPDQPADKENLKLCSQTVFEILDYLSRWMQEKRKEVSNIRSSGSRSSRAFLEADFEQVAFQISSLESVLGAIPADTVSSRAVECSSFARALFNWEQHMKQICQRSLDAGKEIDMESYYERLQEIYTQIDEPDGIEGISCFLQVLNVDQHILQHRKAGRWTAAQSYYEMLLAEKPDDPDIHFDLMTCLRESGQHGMFKDMSRPPLKILMPLDMLLSHVDSLSTSPERTMVSLPFAAEASWMTGKYGKLRSYVARVPPDLDIFNIGVGKALIALGDSDIDLFEQVLAHLQAVTANGLSTTNTTSLQECHEAMLRFHVLTEMEAISRASRTDKLGKPSFEKMLNQRLDIIGPFYSDKQYILGIRRAGMELCGLVDHIQYLNATELDSGNFRHLDIAAAWLTSAQLARKANFTHQAFSAVLHAYQLGDSAAMIEHARLLWKEKSHRKAIKSLEGAIKGNAFSSYSYTAKMEIAQPTNTKLDQNPPKGLAQLLLAKWIDRAGQTQSKEIISRYAAAAKSFSRWEKGHFHLARYYNRLLESEKAKPPAKQAQTYITGETAKLVIDNYLRSLAFGAKYTYQAMPRVLTIWLNQSESMQKPLDAAYGNEHQFLSHMTAQRKKLLAAVQAQIKKYSERLPAWYFYTALSQVVARICHPNPTTADLLVDIVAKVVLKHTPQALWTLLAMTKSRSSADRVKQGMACQLRTVAYCGEHTTDGKEMREAIQQGQRLSDQLLRVCEGEVPPKTSHVNISKHLGFNHKLATTALAMPIESALTASLPTGTSSTPHKHKAFSADYVRMVVFLEEVQVLASLMRPRKISIRGSDGNVYALLCKPKDDLRKDQRLMEFNAMINRSLKKDADSSKRRLYIKTYAVTPLNEECGLIEWIDNLRTLRDILLKSYSQKNIIPKYPEIRDQLNEAISAPNKLPIFANKLLRQYPPVFYEWFIEMFPEPGSWFAARLRYTRSCAVMSIVGHVLGLGDRHGENILFEEGNGGTFHVDFNCLFDKGLTFEKPELVPFRLTHNMVDAMGAYKYEGPFRKSAELTMGICRQNEETLMTILESFLYDPTTDFIGKKKKRDPLVPDTPEGVLESVRGKVRGFLAGESVPLSVEGYVDELIRQATDPFKLASMYIGWCPFF